MNTVVYICDCGPIANYCPPQLSLLLHLNLIQPA